jgi:hypothetical protein
LRATRTGIGTALREARETRGITLQKASRETRIHTDYLTALERESYDALRAEVYVRGFLRSYSSYLGLDADKVLTVYDRRTPSAAPIPPDPLPGTTKRGLGVPRRGVVSWKLAVGLAVVLLGVFGAVGLLTGSEKALPTTTTLPAAPSQAVALPAQVTVQLSPIHITYARVVADGVRRFAGLLPLRKIQTFTADNLLRVEFNHGEAVDLVVNGLDLGRVGDPDAPYQASFGPRDFGGARATPEPKAEASTSANG